jgi:hypothetical protein
VDVSNNTGYSPHSTANSFSETRNFQSPYAAWLVNDERGNKPITKATAQRKPAGSRENSVGGSLEVPTFEVINRQVSGGRQTFVHNQQRRLLHFGDLDGASQPVANQPMEDTVFKQRRQADHRYPATSSASAELTARAQPDDTVGLGQRTSSKYLSTVIPRMETNASVSMSSAFSFLNEIHSLGNDYDSYGTAPREIKGAKSHSLRQSTELTERTDNSWSSGSALHAGMHVQSWSELAQGIGGAVFISASQEILLVSEHGDVAFFTRPSIRAADHVAASQISKSGHTSSERSRTRINANVQRHKLTVHGNQPSILRCGLSTKGNEEELGRLVASVGQTSGLHPLTTEQLLKCADIFGISSHSQDRTPGKPAHKESRCYIQELKEYYFKHVPQQGSRSEVGAKETKSPTRAYIQLFGLYLKVVKIFVSIRRRMPATIVYFNPEEPSGDRHRARSQCRGRDSHVRSLSCKCSVMSNFPFPDFAIMWENGANFKYALESGSYELYYPGSAHRNRSKDAAVTSKRAGPTTGVNERLAEAYSESDVTSTTVHSIASSTVSSCTLSAALVVADGNPKAPVGRGPRVSDGMLLHEGKFQDAQMHLGKPTAVRVIPTSAQPYLHVAQSVMHKCFAKESQRQLKMNCGGRGGGTEEGIRLPRNIYDPCITCEVL